MTTVLVDGRNVQRSRWPNLSDEEVVRGTEAWAAREGVDPVIAFDGGARARVHCAGRRHGRPERRRLDHRRGRAAGGGRRALLAGHVGPGAA